METHADSSQYSILGFGSGANIALFYIKEMMMNDTTTALKSLVLVNPFISVDQNMASSVSHVMQAAEHQD
jgi:alpha-beta hydrolase superfamily lysophospholipase